MIQNNIFIVIEHNLKYHLSLFLWSTSLVFLRSIAKHSVLCFGWWEESSDSSLSAQTVSIIPGEQIDVSSDILRTASAGLKIISNYDNVC